MLFDDAGVCVSCFVEINSLTSNCVFSGCIFEPCRYGRFWAKVRRPLLYVRVLLNLKWMKDFMFFIGDLLRYNHRYRTKLLDPLQAD